MNYPTYFNDLVESLRKFPGIGNKSAIRMAFQLIEMKHEDIDLFVEAFSKINTDVKYCQRCHCLSEDILCEVCLDNTRDTSTICVVSNYKDVFSIEKMNEYQGVYHVLNGDIAISKGITPDKLNIDTLLKRIDDNTKEIILACNPNIEGETTILYLSKVLSDYNIKVTRIAHGLPIGANIDYVDELTMLKAFEGRNQINR